MSNPRISFDRDSMKIFRVDYHLEITKECVILTEKTATVQITTKGDAIAAAVQAKIEALEKADKNAGDIHFMVSNVVYEGESPA